MLHLKPSYLVTMVIYFKTQRARFAICFVSLWLSTDQYRSGLFNCQWVSYINVTVPVKRFENMWVNESHDTTTTKEKKIAYVIVRRARLLWSQQDFEWRWSVPLFKCLTVLEFSFILFDLCLLITFFNFIMNYVPIVTFWIFTYHKIWILSIMFCSIWSYWIIYFLACLEVSWRVVS